MASKPPLDPGIRRQMHGRVKPMHPERCGLRIMARWIAALIAVAALAAFIILF